MGTGHFTRLKGRTSYFRRKIPHSLRSRFAAGEICIRLGVIDRDSAERRARRLAVSVDEFFVSALSNQMLASDDLKKVVASTLAQWASDDERSDAELALRWGTRSGSPKELAECYAEMAQEVLRSQAKGHNLHDSSFVMRRLDEVGVPSVDDPLALHIIGQHLSVALATHYLTHAVKLGDQYALSAGRKGLPVEQWRQHLHGLRDATDHGVPIGADKAPTAAGSRSKKTAGLFSDVLEVCLNDRIATGAIDASARHHSRASARIWLEVCGDRPVDQYGRRDMAEFRSVLVRVPASYWKSKAEQQKPILLVIAEAEAENSKYQRVSNVTINKHLSTIAPVFDWCATNGELPEGIAKFWTGFHLPTGRRVTGLRANEERPAYSREQIRQIFSHPVWTGRKSAFFYTSPGDVIIRDSLYWGPLIAALHGMRREEFSQLRVQHVRQIDGIWVFDLHHVEVKTKNASSPRYVPLHRGLLRLGFVVEVIEGRDAREGAHRRAGKTASRVRPPKAIR